MTDEELAKQYFGSRRPLLIEESVKMLKQARADEREACAEIADKGDQRYATIADLIRARGSDDG